MPNLRSASSETRVPSADSVRGPTHQPGFPNAEVPPAPLDRLAYSVQSPADYPYGQLRLKPWTEPVAQLSSFMASGLANVIQDEAELQNLFIQPHIDSHLCLSGGTSDLVWYQSRLCSVMPIRRRIINMRKLFGSAAWDGSAYVQEVRRRRTDAAAQPDDGQSTTTSLAQGAAKPDGAIVLTLSPVAQEPGSGFHSFPVLVGENKFSLAEWNFECGGRGTAEMAARSRHGLVYASREGLFQAAEHLVLAGQLGGARYGLAVANSHYYRLFRKADGVIALEVPDGHELSRFLSVDELRAHLEQWRLPPNKLVNISAGEVDGRGSARFSAFDYAACQVLGSGRFVYDLAHRRSGAADPVFGSTPAAQFRGSLAAAVATHDHREKLHEFAEKAKRRAGDQPMDPAGALIGRRSRSPEDDSGAAGPSREAGRGGAQPVRASKRRRTAQNATPQGGTESHSRRHDAGRSGAATPSPVDASQQVTSGTSSPTEAAVKALNMSLPPRDRMSEIFAWVAASSPPIQQDPDIDCAETADMDAPGGTDELVGFGESSEGDDPLIRTLRHLRDAGVKFQAVSPESMDRMSMSPDAYVPASSGWGIDPAISRAIP